MCTNIIPHSNEFNLGLRIKSIIIYWIIADYLTYMNKGGKFSKWNIYTGELYVGKLLRQCIKSTVAVMAVIRQKCFIGLTNRYVRHLDTFPRTSDLLKALPAQCDSK